MARTSSLLAPSGSIKLEGEVQTADFLADYKQTMLKNALSCKKQKPQPVAVSSPQAAPVLQQISDQAPPPPPRPAEQKVEKQSKKSEMARRQRQIQEKPKEAPKEPKKTTEHAAPNLELENAKRKLARETARVADLQTTLAQLASQQYQKQTQQTRAQQLQNSLQQTAQMLADQNKALQIQKTFKTSNVDPVPQIAQMAEIIAANAEQLTKKYLDAQKRAEKLQRQLQFKDEKMVELEELCGSRLDQLTESEEEKQPEGQEEPKAAEEAALQPVPQPAVVPEEKDDDYYYSSEEAPADISVRRQVTEQLAKPAEAVEEEDEEELEKENPESTKNAQ